MGTFTSLVLRVVSEIQPGQTLSYSEVARRAGRPKACRAVGTILHRIWQTDRGRTVPCHRVVRSDGSPGGYAGGFREKQVKLKAEQVDPSIFVILTSDRRRARDNFT